MATAVVQSEPIEIYSPNYIREIDALLTEAPRELQGDRRLNKNSTRPYTNDAELIGIPTIVSVGKALADGEIEVKDRKTGERSRVAVADAAAALAVSG